MTYGTRLKATLPRDVEDNGLAAIRAHLLAEPSAHHVAIVVLDVARIIDEVDDDVRVPVVRILRVEPEPDPDRAAALLARCRELSEERVPPPRPLLDVDEAAGLRNTTGLRLAYDGGELL